MAFDEVARTLDEESVVAIVTTRRNGERTATAIWAMVVDGVPYVRSAFGDGSWWYRHVLAGRPVAFVTQDGSLAETDRAAALELPREEVALEEVPRHGEVHQLIDAEIQRKYQGAQPSSIEAMLSDEAIACTFRVRPV